MTNTNYNTKTVFREHEQAKKKGEYMQRVLEIEHGSHRLLWERTVAWEENENNL